MKVKR